MRVVGVDGWVDGRETTYLVRKPPSYLQDILYFPSFVHGNGGKQAEKGGAEGQGAAGEGG